MKKRLVCICLMLCVFLTGCMPQRNNTTAENRRRVVVILKAMDSIHWMEVADGLRQAANGKNISLTILISEAGKRCRYTIGYDTGRHRFCAGCTGCGAV